MGPSGQAGAGVALLDRHPWGLQISPRRGWNHLTLKAGSPSKETDGVFKGFLHNLTKMEQGE